MALVGTTVYELILSSGKKVEVLIRSGIGEVWATVKSGESPAAPVASAAENYFIGQAPGDWNMIFNPGTQDMYIKFLGNGHALSVEAV